MQEDWQIVSEKTKQGLTLGLKGIKHPKTSEEVLPFLRKLLNDIILALKEGSAMGMVTISLEETIDLLDMVHGLTFAEDEIL